MSRIYDRKKLSHTEAGKQRCGKNCHISQKGRTREIIGKELGVSARTVENAAAFGKAIESLGELGEPIKKDIQDGKRVIKKDVMAAAKAMKDGDEEKAKH